MSARIGRPRPDWVVRAACRAAGIDLEDFYPEGHPNPGETIARAKAVCAPCTVRPECFAWGNLISPQFGIFGGLTASERRNRLARTGAVAA